jgi:hypothetical protein
LASLFADMWEGEKENKKHRRVPDVSFQELEENKHNFVSLRFLV